MSKQLTGPQIMRASARALAGANAAIAADQLDGVEQHIDQAHHLILDGALPMALHETLINEWSEIARLLQQRGCADLAGRCRKIADLLQSRLDEGNYTRTIF